MLVAFPLRVSQRLKNQISALAQQEGKKVGPFARELLAAGFEARLVRLRQMGEPIDSPPPLSTKEKRHDIQD